MLDLDVFSNQKWDRLKESRANRVSCPEAPIIIRLVAELADYWLSAAPDYACQNVTVTISWCRTGHLEVVEAWAARASAMG